MSGSNFDYSTLTGNGSDAHPPMKTEKDDTSGTTAAVVQKEENDEDGHEAYFLYKLLLVLNVAAWCWSNGMNGIAMQSYSMKASAALQEQQQEEQYQNQDLYYYNGDAGAGAEEYNYEYDDGKDGITTSTTPPSDSTTLLHIMVITTTITCMQLILGAIVGRIVLLFLGGMTGAGSSSGTDENNGEQSAARSNSISWSQIVSTHWVPLSSTHALGSVATNLGFMYGKASAIQLIKLLEPFETLLLSLMFFKEEGKRSCSVGIVSAMTVVVGAAMSLIELQPTRPVPEAIFFAVVSGIVISFRNVLQRKHHQQKHISEDKPKKQDDRSNDKNHSLLGSGQGKQVIEDGKPQESWTKLEMSIVQFTQNSLFSAIWTSVTALLLFVLNIMIVSWGRGGDNEMMHPIRDFIFPAPPIQLILWHPMYNIFSMITLGCVVALTHSLLNAGKRVVTISMAMLWFGDEGLLTDGGKTVAGLVLVGVGGLWYTWESKQRKAMIDAQLKLELQQQEEKKHPSITVPTTTVTTAPVDHGGDPTTGTGNVQEVDAENPVSGIKGMNNQDGNKKKKDDLSSATPFQIPDFIKVIIGALTLAGLVAFQLYVGE